MQTKGDILAGLSTYGRKIVQYGLRRIPARYQWEIISLLPVSNIGVPAPPDEDIIEKGEADLDRVLRQIEQHTGQSDVSSWRVLDIGCGVGRLLIPLAKRGCDAHGIDISRGFLKQCEMHAREHGVSVTLEHIDGGLPDYEQSFDLVVAAGLFGAITRRQTYDYQQQIADVLTPDGVAYFTYPNLETEAAQDRLFERELDHDHPFRYRYFTDAEIRTTLKRSGFDDITVLEHDGRDGAVPQYNVIAQT